MLPVTTIKWIRNPDGSPGFEWNPVVGCNRQCPDCNIKQLDATLLVLLVEEEKQWFARFRQYNITKERFNTVMRVIEYLNHFSPTFLNSRYLLEFPIRPSSIIVNTLSDICYWQGEWMADVLMKIRFFSKHTFIFLTKNLNSYRQYEFPPNVSLGVVVDSDDRLSCYEKVYQKTYSRDGSIHPNPFFFVIRSLEALRLSPIYYMARWIILDIADSNHYPDTKANRNIDSLLSHYHNKIKIYMQDNCKEFWNAPLIQEFPDFSVSA